MRDQSAVITGLGAVSACGNTIDRTLENFSVGNRSGRKLTLFQSDLPYPVFEVTDRIGDEPGIMRTLQLALFAARQAIAESGLTQDMDDFRVGVCLGTTVGSQLNDTDFYREYKDTGSAPLNSVDRYLKGNLSAAVADKFKAGGPVSTVVNACSSGTDAIGVGLSWLRADLCDIVICGGADELNRIPLCGFAALSVMSNSLCRPFDRDRSGLNLGEGAGVIVLEKESICRKRGGKAQFFLSGYGLASDAYHLTAPRPDGRGLETALARALKEAAVKPSEISFINAHGTATHDNDKVEGMVLAKVFGPQVTFLSTKGFTGHTLGAAGGLEAVFTCLGLRENWIPVSAGFAVLDEEIGIAPVEKKTTITGKYAVSTSLAFGGNNSAIVIAKG